MLFAERAYRVSLGGSLLGLACVLGLVEAVLLPPIPVPGVRLGLANVAVLLAFVVLGRRWALLVSMCRVFIVGAVTGTLLGPAGVLSTVGAFAAWAVVVAMSSFGARFSVVGWSIGAASAHAAAQMLVAWSLIGSVFGVGLLGLVLPVAAITGLATGLVTFALLSRLAAPLGDGMRRIVGVGAGGAATTR